MNMSTILDTLAGSNGTAQPQPASSSSTVRLIPYDARADKQAVDFLAWLWRKLQADDLVDYYFPGERETGYAMFVRMLSGDAEVGLVDTGADSNQWEDRIAGFISWTPLKLGTREMAVAGLIFFKKFWDHRTSYEAGQLALRYWFTQTKVESVLGVCPAPHVLINRYNKRMGLHECGTLKGAHMLHGQVCDATLWEITKDEWLAKGER